VCVCDNAEYFHGQIDQHLKLYGLTTGAEGKPLYSRDIVDIIEGYKGRGYGVNTDEELSEGWD
jgi:thiamine pyrophosphate-dependent acetolactate synthase large subunit-like protein